MSFSSLTDKIQRSPNNSGRRTHEICRITPHCWVGQVTVENGLNSFMNKSKKVSSNYIIGCDGRVGGCVDEENRSWCSSSNDNDQRAITIECASDVYAPNTFREVVYNKLVDLCTDICKRYNKTKLVWIDNKEQALSYENKDHMVLTVHRWFANKSCPGNWLMSKMPQLADEVTGRLHYKEDTCMIEVAILRKGDQGQSVKAMQALLKLKGFKGATGKVLTIDGDFGNNSEFALKAFQLAMGLTPDGICGAKTWPLLLR